MRLCMLLQNNTNVYVSVRYKSIKWSHDHSPQDFFSGAPTLTPSISFSVCRCGDLVIGCHLTFFTAQRETNCNNDDMYNYISSTGIEMEIYAMTSIDK